MKSQTEAQTWVCLQSIPKQVEHGLTLPNRGDQIPTQKFKTQLTWHWHWKHIVCVGKQMKEQIQPSGRPSSWKWKNWSREEESLFSQMRKLFFWKRSRKIALKQRNRKRIIFWPCLSLSWSRKPCQQAILRLPCQVCNWVLKNNFEGKKHFCIAHSTHGLMTNDYKGDTNQPS